MYEQVADGEGELAAVAAYHRARVMLQSRRNGVGAALREVVARFPDVESAGAAALLLLADLQIDGADLAGAASSLGELTRRYPKADQAPLARFRAGLIAFGRDARRAAATFDSLAALHPDHEEALAARYWRRAPSTGPVVAPRRRRVGVRSPR